MNGYYSLLLLANSILLSLAQCPTTITAPCSCSSTRYEPVSIHCDRADSFESVLRALANPPQYIDSLTISNTPIDLIPEGLFAGLSIKKLIFQNNGLRDIHKGAFSGKLTDTLEQLEIRTNGLESIPEHGITELHNLESLVLSDCQIQSVSEYTFLHYQSRTRLKKLDLSANKISSLPAQSLLGLDNLEILILDKNSFTNVPIEALKNVATLEDLSLSVNKISRISETLPLPNLKSLSLEVNQIETLKSEVFQQASGLLYLYLSNNRFPIFDPKMFYYVPHLKVLAMSHNVAIKLIPFNAFQYTPSLIRLEMTDCSVGTVEQGAFHNTPKIQVISLARNKIQKIGISMFNTLPHVQSIDISVIDDYAFSRLKMLQKLDLSSNKLETLLPNVFFDTFDRTAQSVLKVLYLYDNPWRCDHQILWLTTWLRQTLDLQITAPGSLPARCNQPPELLGMDLRNANSMISTNAPPIKKAAKPGNSMRAINSGVIEDLGTKSTLQPFDRERAAIAITPWATIFTIIVITMILLFLGISIVFLVNYVAKKRSKKTHSQSSSDRGDFGIDSSTASGFASLYGSSGMLACDAQSRRPYVGGLPRQPYDVGEPHNLSRSNQTDGVLLNCTETDSDQLVQTLKQSQAELGLIKWLILERIDIPHLPANYFSGLYIKRLDLIGNGMQSVDGEAFAGLGTTLLELHIQKNNLTRVPAAALSKLNSLLRLDLSENNLHSLEEIDTLPALTKMYDLNLARNKISNIHRQFFEANKQYLQTINLGHNHLKSVPESALRGFRKLMALHLHNNRLEKLEKMSFMNLPVLNLLNLASNKIESMDRQALVNVPKLRYLYLTDNRLRSILPYQFISFEQLEMIDLSNNMVTEIPKNGFSSLSNVRQIYLAGNRISSISNDAFLNSTTVILILEGNKLQHITENMFDGLFALQQLSLKDNQITDIDPKAFRNTASLMMIDLGKNQIQSLAPATFIGQVNLLLVDLSENKLPITPYAAFSNKVATVLLQENPLVCSERVHMLQQGLGVFVPNSEDRICAGQKAIEKTIASESPSESVFKVENTENTDNLFPQVNPLPSVPQTARIPVETNIMPKINNPINIQSISSSGSSSIIRPVNEIPGPAVPERPTSQPSTEKDLPKPEQNSTGVPYPDDPDHPDNHPGRYYPLPIPYLSKPPKLNPAYIVTQTLPPSIVIADDSREISVNTVEGNTDESHLEQFEEPNQSVFQNTNGIAEGERKAYELDDQQTALKARKQMPMTLIIICLSTVAIVMIAVFVGLCVARQRSGNFVGSSSSSTTARSNAQFATQMNQMYGTLPHPRAGTLPRQCGQEDIYNWLYGHGGYNAYSKA
ncbi:hypothetical protein FO519_002987 [Halicephalobus sp. NKZ332]|nr:hypothetical protein FO519_002987 [Halicephalobus sp. NKZ332]